MSGDDVNRLLDYQLSLGASSSSPLIGSNSQGTLLSDSFSGGVGLGARGRLASIGLGTPVAAGVTSTAPILASGMDLDEDVVPFICMFVTSSANMENTCHGCIGAKGEKFCTKKKVEPGELATCGVNSHTKKAVVKPLHNYFTESEKHLGYTKPALDTTYALASCVWAMRHEPLSRVQFRELIQLITSQSVTTEEELLDAKARVLNPAKGVSFTPRKKPRFSSDASWEYAEEDLLPTISEAPGGAEDLQDHIAENWSSMLKTVEAVKANSSKQKRYESEIVRLSEDVNDLRSLASRLLNLVGQPSDGIKYDLYAIVDVAEDRFMEVEAKVKTEVIPRVAKLEETTGDLTKDIHFFKKNIGGDVANRIQRLEEAMKSFELTAGVSSSADVGEMRKLLLNEIIPAVRDLWDLYMLATKGPGETARPGSGEAAGKHLFSRLNALESKGLPFGGGAGGPGLELRVQALENQAVSEGHHAGGSMPSLFGPGFGTVAGGGGDTRMSTPPGSEDHVVADISQRLSGLAAKIKEMEAQLGNVTVHCGGQTFRSIEDCETFVIEHVPGNTYAYFYDMISLLQRGWGEKHVAVSDVWDKTYNMKRAGFTCKGEAVIFASMNTILPTCLGELTGKTSESTQPLPAIPTHGHWTSKGGMLGRRRDINNGLTHIRSTLEHQRKHHFGGNLVGSSVVKELMSDSNSHWTHFQTMLDDFYSEFSTSGTPAEAWRLTGMIGKTVLEAISLVRCIAADLSDLLTPVKRASRILWATLQAHRVMGEFVAAEFRNDPRVAPIVVLHLLENRVNKSEVEAMEARLKAQDVAMAKMRRELDGLVSKVNSKLSGKKKRNNDEDEE
jgi:hypothetical protein